MEGGDRKPEGGNGGSEERYPELAESLEKYYELPPKPSPAPLRRNPGDRDSGASATGSRPTPAPVNRSSASTQPFINAVYDAAQDVDGSDAHFTWINYHAGEARDFPVLLHGNVATPGDVVPRHFLTVLSQGRQHLQAGLRPPGTGGRIFTDGAPLAARVIVNRVWGWHFGRALVATTSDFGAQGEKPTHPELLDDLAARFIAHGWSLKWLNREIMLSAAYRQSSQPRAGRRESRSR